MAPGPRLVSAEDLIVYADFGQIYVWSLGWDIEDDEDDDEPPELAALDDAWFSGRFVGVRRGFIDVLTPGNAIFTRR